jgi:hypothetical protein
MFGGSAAGTEGAAAVQAIGWKRDSRHRFILLAIECFRRELISLRKFDELRRLVGVEDAEADSLLEAVAAIADDDDPSPKERAREPRS